MAKVSSEEFVEKHARRLKGALEDMRRGVERVSEAPTKKAAAKADKMRANIVAAIDSGKWARGLSRVSLEDWKSKMVDKGLNRVASGIDAAAPKVKAFADEFLPYLDNVQSKVKAMPDTTLEDNINRMVTQIREVSKFKRRG